jgi:hypothetical protein
MAGGGYNAVDRTDMKFGDNGILLINYNTQDAAKEVLINDATEDDTTTGATSGAGDYYLVFYEDADNTGTFSNVDNKDDSNLEINTEAARGTTATIDYNDDPQSIVVANDFGVIDMDENSVGSEWNSGETLIVTLIDQDLNKNTLNDEDLLVSGLDNRTATLVPSLKVGSPVMVKANATAAGTNGNDDQQVSGAGTVSSFSNIGTLTADIPDGASTVTVQTGYTYSDIDAIDSTFNYFNADFTSFGTVTSALLKCENNETLATTTAAKEMVLLTMNTACSADDVMTVHVATTASGVIQGASFVADVF